MEYDEKILVILDTNMIRKNLEWEKDYSKFEPKGDFLDIINFIEQNKLEESLFVGLPQIVVDEFIINRTNNFNSCINEITTDYGKLKNIPNFNLPKESMISDSFTYKDFMKNKIEAYVKKKSFIIILELEKEIFSETLSTLIEKAILKKLPFTDKGKGFKDALIWEIILNQKYINKYSFVFIITENQNDFKDLPNEFEKKFMKKLVLVSNFTELLVKLDRIYDWKIKYRKLISYLYTEYSQQKLSEYFENYLSVEINNFQINKILDISDLDGEEMIMLTDEYSLPQECLDQLVCINYSFKNNNEIFEAILYLDQLTKQIFKIDYKEIDDGK